MSAADWSKRREQFEFALSFLGSWWREWTIALALIVLVLGWRKHNADQQAIGQLRERFRVADSTLKIVRPAVMHYDTVIVRDTVKLNRVIAQLKTLHDTARITDTLWVKRFVTTSDSAIQACTELSNDCQAFRTNATAVIAAQDTKIRALESLKAPHPCGFMWGIGPAVVYGGGVHAGVGATVGVGCRF